MPGAVGRDAVGAAEARARADAVAVEAGRACASDRDDIGRGRGPHADAVVRCVRDVNVPRAVGGDALGAVERGTRARRVAVEEVDPGAGYRDDVTSGQPAHAVVGRVRDVHAAQAVGRDAVGPVELDARRHAVAAIARGARARDGDDAPRRRPLAHAVVGRVRDVHVPGGVHGDAAGLVKLDARRHAVAVVALGARAHDGDDAPRGRPLAEAIVARVRDVHVVGAVNRDATGVVEARARSWAVAVEVARAGDADDSGNDARGQLAHTVVRRVGYVHVARAVDRDAARDVHLR